MNNTGTQTSLNHISLFIAALLGLFLLVGVSGCGGGGGGSDDDETPPIVNTVNNTVAGYYTGSASVKMADNTTALAIPDLQVFVQGSRIMAMGLLTDVANFVLYDITISSISGDSYTAVATVYKAGENITTADVTGTITEGTSLEGTFAGSGIANGTFSVTFDTAVNAKTTDLSTIANSSYRGAINASGIDLRLDINATGDVVSSAASSDAVKLAGCDVVTGSSLTAIVDENLYDLVFVLSGCDDATVDGTYTGLMTLSDDIMNAIINGFMSVSFSNGSFAGTAVFEKN